jgi:hypothetical protein
VRSPWFKKNTVHDTSGTVNFESPLHKSNQVPIPNSTVAIKMKIISTAINVCEVFVEKYHGNEDASQNTRCVWDDNVTTGHETESGNAFNWLST